MDRLIQFTVIQSGGICAKAWHRTKQNPKSFSAKYNLDKLVYYEGFHSIMEAVAREKYIKGKSNQWKLDVIKSQNPEWKDLTDTISALV